MKAEADQPAGMTKNIMSANPQPAPEAGGNSQPSQPDMNVVHVPTPVVYLGADAGGVSHYRGVRDTLLIAGAHFWLCTEGVIRILTWPIRALIRKLRRG